MIGYQSGALVAHLWFVYNSVDGARSESKVFWLNAG